MRALFDLLFGNRQAAQKQRVEDAVKVHAAALSDAEFHRHMANFYTRSAEVINPNTHWWEYADAKQKEHDHTQSYARYVGIGEEAAARWAAEQERYATLAGGAS